MGNSLVFLVFLLIFAAYNSSAHQHNLFYGNCAPSNDTVPIYTQVVVMANPHTFNIPSKPVRRWYTWLSNISLRRRQTTTTPKPIVSGGIINTTVIYPPPGTRNDHLIKCIQVLDNVANGIGGFASVTDGGINKPFTKILLKSQPGGPLNFTVTIYSYKTHALPASYNQAPLGWKLQPNQQQQQHNQYNVPQRPHYPWPVHKKK